MEDQRQKLVEKEAECKNLNFSSASGTCKPLWDTILCWPETVGGKNVILPCPLYIAGNLPERNATRLCYDNGTWHWWANYSQCSDTGTFTETSKFDGAINDTTLQAYLPIVTDVTRAGYSISLVALIFAFCILAFIRTLWCPRNILHMNLFASFIMRAFVSLLKDAIFVLDIGLPNNIETINGEYYLKDNQELWECKLVFSIWQYFMLANYNWILMEGLYLHNLIFNALFSDRSGVKLYIILGWGLPYLFVIPWIVCRILLEDLECWTVNENKYIFAIMEIPMATSNIVCFVLFINLVRVIFTKLQSSISETTQIYRRLAKSTLILIPLFGVHYILYLGFKFPSIDPEVEIVGIFINQLFTSFQGFFVALLYCFLNAEVRTELNKTRSWWPWRRNTDASDGKSFLFNSANSECKIK